MTSIATVLVYGADRPLGRRLVYYLEHYSKQVENAVTVVMGTDPTDMETVQKEVWETYTTADGSQRPTLVANLHYSDDLRRLEADPEWAFTTNTIPASNIALAARGAGIPMIQISTDHVFKGSAGPYDPDDQPQPVNMFGASLWYAEQAVASFYPVISRDGEPFYRGAAVIRVSSLYGGELTGGLPHTIGLIDAQAHSLVRDLTSSPSFVGEVAFLLARNIIQSPQMLARQFIHLAPAAAPTSWYDMLRPTELKITPVDHDPFTSPLRVGKRLGLTPTVGWVLPADYQKGLKEHFHEMETGSWVHYW